MKIKKLLNLFIVCLFAFTMCLPSFVLAQKGKDSKSKKSDKPEKELPKGAISVDNFSQETLEAYVSVKINSYRKQKGMDTLRYNEILSKAARDQAEYMARKEEATTEGSGKKSTTGKRVAFYGGAESADELVMAQPGNKGKDFFTYEEVASIVVDKWIKGKATGIIVYNNTYIYQGVGAVIEPNSKKIYVSDVFGSFNTFNIGPEKRMDLPVPYTKKKYRLKPLDEKECKSCAKFADMEKLWKGISVKEGKIYFKYPNVKVLQKLLKNKRDGLAVDIIQREQYPCAPYNIYDTKLISKGYMLKRKWSKKIFKKNLIKDPKNKGIEIEMGALPKGLHGNDYEINLMVIQNKHVCKTLTRKYVEDGGMQSLTPLDLLPDTVKKENLKYKPMAETKTLTFNVPFEKNKFTYATEDIIPFIESLNEPDFAIDKILITAFSSIEGDSLSNALLQKKRAESIMLALEKMQKKQAVQDIQLNDSWEMFKKQVVGTKYAPMAMMAKSDVVSAINNGLAKDMDEAILSKERYAEIKITVTYDIQGAKEQPYVVRALKKAIEKKDGSMALNIQQYMISRFLDTAYTAESILNLVIPKEPQFANIINNQIWFEQYSKHDTISPEIAAKFYEIAKIAPKNEFIAYNSTLCNVKLAPLGKEKQLDSVQTKINDLYTTPLPKDRIDAVNLEYQFKIIDALDPVENAKPIVQKSIDRIRNIYKIEGSSWQNALKLAYIFIRNGDLEFSLKILEPFVDRPDIDENLAFTYLSLCTYYPEKLNSPKFVSLMRKAKDLNQRRYCKLFGAPYMTFQILDNPFVKDDFCKSCEEAAKNTPVESKSKSKKK